MQNDDLISRSALKKYLRDYRFEFVRNSDFCKAIEMIDCAPTVDAVILPCKPGSTVFQIDRYPNNETCGDCMEYCPAFPGDLASCAKDDGYFRCVDCMTISETVATIDYILTCLKFKWFGEFVFLTREEAEAALTKMNLGV